MDTNTKEHPSTEKPLVNVSKVCFFTLPEETREVFRADRNGVLSDLFAGAVNW